MTKLELQIILDSKGAVQGVKALDKELGGLSNSSKKADGAGKGLAQSIFGQVTAANLATQAVNKLTSFVQESALAYMEAEKQQARMNVVLRRSGEDVSKASNAIDDFAGKMEYLTGVDDDQIKSLEILARQYNIQKDRINDAVKSAIALTEIGGSLEMNLKAVADAYQGNWTGLNKLLPEMRAANRESERMEILQRAVATGFEMSTAAMKTNAGKLKELASFWDDLKKAVGGAIVDVAHGFDTINGMRSTMRDIAREQITEQERLNQEFEDSIDMVDAAIARQRKAKGWNADPTPGQLGFIDIESDLATGWLADTNAGIQFQNMLDKLEESKKKHIEVEKTLAEIIDERWKAANKAYEEDKAYAAFIESKFSPAIESYSDAWAENIDVTNMAQDAMDGIQGTFDKMAADILKKGDKIKADEITQSWQDLEAQIQAVNRAIGYIDDMFAALGINASGVTAQISKGLGAVSSYASGMASLGKEGATLTDKLTGVTSIIGAVSAAISIATSIIKAFAGDGIGEAIDRENEWMGLNEQLEDQLRDLAKETGSVHEATSIMLDEIIAGAAIGIDNFEQYADRIRGILSELDRGELTLAETQAEIGDSFSALIAKAEELGTTGSSSLLTLFDDLKGRGIEVAEITEYINAQMTSGLDGYRKYLEGDLSDATIGVFEGMLAYEKKVGENRGLIDGVQGITDALVGMSNATRLTEEEFDNFEMAARDAFDALRKKGFTEKESLTEMAPMLSRMIFLHNEYGLAIDAETQALIDKAKAEGVNLDKYKSQEEIFSDMDSSLRELVDIFKNAFPNAINATTNAFRGLNKEANNFNPDTEYTKPIPGKPDIVAAEGFYSPRLSRDTVIQAHRGEEVIITPQREVGGGGQRVTNINIALYGSITPESAADAIMRAWRDNTRGMRSLMES